jgi:hypothetical protein
MEIDPMLLSYFMCEACCDEHGENPQSVSCYCGCHSSRRDEARWPTIRAEIVRVLREETPEQDG